MLWIINPFRNLTKPSRIWILNFINRIWSIIRFIKFWRLFTRFYRELSDVVFLFVKKIFSFSYYLWFSFVFILVLLNSLPFYDIELIKNLLNCFLWLELLGESLLALNFTSLWINLFNFSQTIFFLFSCSLNYCFSFSFLDLSNDFSLLFLQFTLSFFHCFYCLYFFLLS